MKKFTIAVHGGAGTISKKSMNPEKEAAYLKALNDALTVGYAVLEKNCDALDAVKNAVIELENNILFNAGKGSVFTNTGTHEMDASIMDGKDLLAGAVAASTGGMTNKQFGRVGDSPIIGIGTYANNKTCAISYWARRTIYKICCG